ncbi:MAG: DUF2911 domain-containing protein [Bacteroidia bacterium]|nr:DUF2911 domain-containing protein [Bacteroidia bacterium]
MNIQLKPLLTLALVLSISAAWGQIRTPAASPAAKVEQRIGLTDITLNYSRPSARERKVFGDLVPYGQVWRTGANQATRISFSDNVKVNGLDVPKGEYALYTLPGKDSWTIMLYKDLSLGGNVAAYDQTKELIRFAAEPQKIKPAVETFTLGVDHITNTSGMIFLSWEETLVAFKVEVEVDSKVQADIDRVLKGPSAGDYYAAASYYYAENKDLNQALEWINKALAENEPFWQVTLKARILGKMGRYADAVATAEKARSLAEKEKNSDYVKINTDLIAEFKKKM